MNQPEPGAQAPILPQLTVKAIVLGILLSMILAGANAYLGLFAGLTVSASIPAAVISMGVLRMFKESNILENNIVQTAASAGESLAAGVIFTIPALVLMGYWQSFDYIWVTTIAGLGGLLGVLFTIPLRRSLIVEEKLVFPEGVATAEVLKVGDEQGGAGLKYLASAGLVGGFIKLCDSGLALWNGVGQAATYVGNSIAFIGSNLSPALLGVGYIVRLNIAMLVFIGGGIAWFIGIPIYAALYHQTDPQLAHTMATGSVIDAAFDIWNRKIRFVGVGSMLLGGIWALISMRKSLLSGIKSGLHQVRHAKTANVDHTDQDMPMNLVLGGIVLFVVPIFILYQLVTNNIGISLSMAVVMVITGFLFSSVAAYMAGLVGSSNNPISGITIATITFSAFLLLLMMGQGHPEGPATAIFVGAVVCCAAAIAGDNLQDLKCGYIVGATPWRQQVMQGVGTISAALVLAPILMLLMHAYGFGPPTAEHPNSLQAPQATLMASVTQGVFGEGLPWNMIMLGMVVAAVVIVIDETLKAKGSDWRSPVLAVAVGIYLPLELATPIFLGGLIAHFSEKISGGEESEGRRHGVLFSAGLITGEALVGILLAIPIVLSGERDVMAIANEPYGSLPGLVVIAGLMYAMYRIAKKR